jgi:uncharacterized LabA/DUF88 family protein
MTNLIQSKLTAAGYVDYENIFELMKGFGKNPLEEINFFPVLLDRFKNLFNLNLIEFIAYSNFEKKPFQARHQSLLQDFGIQTRHSSNYGKNSADLELTCDALKALFKNPAIEVFILISSDRDLIPLIKCIRSENKKTYVLSTKNGFNEVVTRYTDFHEYIEDIFNLTPLANGDLQEPNPLVIEETPSYSDLEHVEEVSKHFHASNILKRSETDGHPITLKGYVDTLSCIVQRDTSQLTKDFQLAHKLGLLEIYPHEKGLCLRKCQK